MIRKSFLLTLALYLLFANCFGQTENSVSPKHLSIPPKEREALLALYASTGGGNWKNHDGWLGPPGTECDWFGVACGGHTGAPTVISLELGENKLNGTIPNELGQLTHLEWLSILGNHLSGKVPESLTELSLSGSLSINAEAPLLTDVSGIDLERGPSALLCGQERIVLRTDGSAYWVTAVWYKKLCRNATPKDRATFCQVKQARISPGYFASVARLLDKNNFYTLQKEYSRNITDAEFVSTRVKRNGETYEVVDYAGGGPFALWVIERAIESTVADADWAKAKRQGECPRWEKGEIRPSDPTK